MEDFEVPIRKLDLPSGNWVEYRDELMALDRFAVLDAVSIEALESGRTRVCLGITNDLRNAMLGRIIIGWSYPDPIPNMVRDTVAADVAIGVAMTLKDYNALAAAVQPLVDQIIQIVHR